MNLPATDAPTALRAIVVGGGPSGMMAAEVLASGGVQVDLFDAMPSVGRKFLLAGKGGLNLTHSEPFEAFVDRYGPARPVLEPMLRSFGPGQLRAWASGLGTPTFVGSSGRVFPIDMKAAPLLRAWLHRLRAAGVVFRMRHRWVGWRDVDDGIGLRFDAPQGEVEVSADVVVLALGGASWKRLGADGAWVPRLIERGIDVAPLRPSNCGFDVVRIDADGRASPGWSEHFLSRFAGHPMKNVGLSLPTADGRGPAHLGEFVVTETGIEGSLVYALSAAARDTILQAGRATLHIDLLPGRSATFVEAEVARPRGSRSLATHLKSRLGIDGVKSSLLHELLPRAAIADPSRLAAALKALPLVLASPRPIDEAISSAGGVRFDALDAWSMARAVPGLFVAGEMLDWEAPTGGHLLTACLSTGRAAGLAALARLRERCPTKASAANV